MYGHFIGLTLADSTGGQTDLSVQLLIGGDHYWKFVTGKIFRGFDGPVAMETMFGWVLSGPLDRCSRAPTILESSTPVLAVGCEPTEQTDCHKMIVEKINEFWDTENLGLSMWRNALSENLMNQLRKREVHNICDGNYDKVWE